MVKAEKVIRIENRAKVKAVKEDKTLGIMTDDDAFGWKKKKVPEITEEGHTEIRQNSLLL